MTRLDIAVTSKNGIQIVHLAGTLDVHNHVSFRETLTDLVERGRHKIVIDFSELTYMGSSGLEVILSHIQRVRDAGGDMVLAAMSPKIYKVFDLLGLPKFFNITDSLDDALSAFHE